MFQTSAACKSTQEGEIRMIRDAFVPSGDTTHPYQILWFYYSDGLINGDISQYLRSPAWPRDGQGRYSSCMT